MTLKKTYNSNANVKHNSEEGKPEKNPLMILRICLCAVIILCIVYNGISAYTDKKCLDEAADNAAAYVREKYGFDAEITDVDAHGYYDRKGYYGFMHFMEYGGKEFEVWTDTEKSCFYDSYQADEIKNALEEYLTENSHGGRVIYAALYSEGVGYYSMFNRETVFDGKNIEEIMKNSVGSVEMVFYDTDFAESDFTKMLQSYDYYIMLTSFDTEAHMEDFYKLNGNELTRFTRFDFSGYQIFAPYITDYYEKSSEGTEEFDITIMETDEFRYAYFPVEYSGYNKTCNTVIAENTGEKSGLKPFFERFDELSWLSKPISEEYSFNSKDGDVWIYYPLDKLQEYDIEKVGLAWCSFGGMSNNRDIERAVICGDYAVFHMPFGENYFMLVDNSGQEEYVAGWKEKEYNNKGR